MKRFALIASLLALPLAATAQFTVFTDNFNNGSTTNHASVPGGTPFASFTSYDVASIKNVFTNTTITPGDFRIAIDAPTSSGLIEVQALFTKAPVTLVNIGDSITLTYTFKVVNPFFTTSAYLGQGLYYSGGQPPVAGALSGAGLTGTSGSGFATGNCQLWQGIFSRFYSNNACPLLTRPPQTGVNTSSANQSLIGNNVTGGFANPAPVTLGSTPAASVTLTPGTFYTANLVLTLADTNTPTLGVQSTLSDLSGTPLVTISNAATGANFLNMFDGMALGRRDTDGSAAVIMDVTNITISENLFGLPGQPYNVTGGGEGCPGNTFPVGLNGSVATNTYYLYTNDVWSGTVVAGTGSAISFPAETVINVPLTNTVIASNTISGFTGSMLGSVVVLPSAPAAIATQPTPVIVASGSIGVFTVGATGGNLTYQWYKNGTPVSGANISGATTPTLVISPVGAGDAAPTAQGYYAIVTSGCGATATTATNSLTLASAASITWQGNNPGNSWDIAISTNFIDGSATPVVFHNGDNVTFDDTGLATLLSIANNYTAPSVVTDSANNQPYIFAGPGTIQGSAALLKTGTAILSINNSNAFTGGTTVSAGTLIISNLFSVGAGQITLSGGILDIPLGFSTAIGLSNNINVTADSTLQFEQRGTFGLILNGAITGNSSATLTINAVNTTLPSTSRVRLYGAFTNNANIVLNTQTGTEIEFAPYLPSGNQVYNGVISGNGGHIIPRGGGSIILNNTNTFNDNFANPPTGYSLFMSSGNAGIGADSVSSTPGIIDASPVGTGILGINVGAESGTTALFSSGGAHTIANTVAFTSTTNTVTLVFGGTNPLTFAGEFDLALAGDSIQGTNRTLQVTNTAATTISGIITDNNANNGVLTGSGIIKIGNGSLYLNGVNTYIGPTTNTAGVLAGTGTIIGPVDVETNGSIGGGSATAIGTLTVNNTLNINGNVFIRVNKSLSPAQSNDVVTVSGALTSTGIGTLTVNNIGAALVVGDKFKVFNKAVTGAAAAMKITGGGMNWANNLALDGSITASSINTGPATNPTNMLFSVSGGNLSISWPMDHLGWTLQSSTNVLSNWVAVAGSSTVTNVVIPISTSVPRTFYRMSLQP